MVGGLAYELAGVRSMGVLPTAVAVLAGVIAVLALTRLCRRVGRWHGRRLVVTDRKLILVSGALGRRVTALPPGRDRPGRGAARRVRSGPAAAR